ncbi:hypothetical protein [Phaeobacter sp. SYSU ZJ3003]|uniref:hypothetical protein n=1 Tax=Phaeobacter sp. SYSU ZJ3003 TaxID=2109330 RepID=UPI00351C8904
MKVILYIGHHKVGSTALQAYLSQNWCKLAKAGILYPAVETRGFANNLKKALGAGDQRAGQHVNIREPHSALAYRMMSDVSDRSVPPQFQAPPGTSQMFRAINNQADMLQPDILILCSEAFANFGQVDPNTITRLAKHLPKATKEIQIYCALRRPDDYMISWHGQRLKVGEKPAPLQGDGFKQYQETIHFNYRLAVEAWTERMPKAQLILRNYSDILATGGSTEDFVAQTDLAVPDDMIPPGRANPSLPRAAFTIMRRANKELARPAAHALSVYLQKHGNDLSPVRNSDVEMFGAPQRQLMAEAFAPIHAYLNALTGQEAFFPDIDQMQACRPVPEEDATRQLLMALDPDAMPDPELQTYIRTLQKSF